VGITFIGIFMPKSTHCVWLIPKNKYSQLKPWVDINSIHGFFILSRGEILLTAFYFFDGGGVTIMIGKKIRMERIMERRSGKTVIIPMDHGITIGPAAGLIHMQETINAVAMGGANAIVIHKGLVETGHRGSRKDLGFIIHLSASTRMMPDPNCKIMVCTVEEAIKLGADAVSVHVNIGAEDEKSMLKDLGTVAKEAMEWGMPLLAMMYTRGPKVENEYDVKWVKHAARIGAELGADIVKVPYTGSPDSFREVVEGCFVPVVIAGGEKMDTDEDILKMVKGAMVAGGSGVSIGRNVFQHDHPTKIVQAISKIVHDGSTVVKELKHLEDKR
jgi:predicted phospho-2-dehydro-3-deoxyheptonate aldolase